jgi:hypothetical protein
MRVSRKNFLISGNKIFYGEKWDLLTNFDDFGRDFEEENILCKKFPCEKVEPESSFIFNGNLSIAPLYGGFLSPKFQSSYFKIFLGWVLLGTLPSCSSFQKYVFMTFFLERTRTILNHSLYLQLPQNQVRKKKLKIKNSKIIKLIIRNNLNLSFRKSLSGFLPPIFQWKLRKNPRKKRQKRPSKIK